MKCPKGKLCGGCPLISLNVDQQAKAKRTKVVELLKSAHYQAEVGWVHMAKEPSMYRNKVIVGFAKMGGKVYSGLYAPKSHKVINTSGCQMQPKLVNEIIDEITKMVQSMKIEIYNPKTRTGILRHVLIRYAKSTDQVMIVLVTARQELPSRKNMVKALTAKFPQIVTILQNVNSRDTSVVLENELIPLYGKGMITDDLGHLKLSYSASAFYQINHDQTVVLYDLAKKMLELNKKDTVLDTYCGVGSIGLFMADSCKSVTGVEVNKEAVNNATYNARANHIENARFVAMDSTKFMQEAKMRHTHFDVIILDPPRAGTTREFIESACALKPKKILYISCDPKTQVRDLNQFRREGYRTRKLELVDMFPNTDHVESLCVLTYDPKVRNGQVIKKNGPKSKQTSSAHRPGTPFKQNRPAKKPGRPGKRIK